MRDFLNDILAVFILVLAALLLSLVFSTSFTWSAHSQNANWLCKRSVHSCEQKGRP